MELMLLVLSNSGVEFAIDIGELKLTTVDNRLNNLQMNPTTDEYRSQHIFLKPFIISSCSSLIYSDSNLFPKFEFPSTLCSGLRFVSLKLQKV